MLSKKFLRVKENFICENCNKSVQGNGYTNHCPDCLYSKHVDVHPGDRAEQCHGLMRPIDIVMQSNNMFIVHECLKCGFIKRNKVQKDDNQETLRSVNKKKIYG